MLNQLLSAVLDWPVIVQGVVGSALFWALLQLGQKIADFAFQHWGRLQSNRKQEAITDEALYYLAQAKGADAPVMTLAHSMRTIRALNRLVQALMWLVLGLIFASVVEVFGVVGYLGALYHLFRAFNTLKSRPVVEDVDSKVTALLETAKKLEEESKASPRKPQ